VGIFKSVKIKKGYRVMTVSDNREEEDKEEVAKCGSLRKSSRLVIVAVADSDIP